MTYAEIFPAPVANFIRDVAIATGAPEDYMALSMLPVGAVCAGRMTLLVRPGHVEHPTAYCVIVGEKGHAKSAAMNMAIDPLVEIQTEESLAFDKAYAKHAEAEAALRGQRGERVAEAKAALAEEAPMPNQQLVITSGTMEGMLQCLHNNQEIGHAPHCIVFKDELRSLFGEMDAYRKKGSSSGGDMEKYLSMFNGADMTTRNVSRRFTIKKARCSILGSIQPDVFRRAMGDGTHENGMFDRMLFACASGFPKETNLLAIVPQQVLDFYRSHIKLCFMDYNRPEGGEGAPMQLALSDNQRLRLQAVLTEYYRIGARHNQGAFKKWELNLFKIILILTALHRRGRVDDDIMEKAIMFARHLVEGWLHAVGINQRSDEDEIEARVLEWAKNRGDEGIKESEVTRTRYFRDRKVQTTTALANLVQSERLVRHVSKTSGRPAVVYFLT